MRLRALFHLVVATSLSLVQGAPASWAQATPASASAVKAAFLLKFASFVEWPAGTFQRPDQPLVIAVSGDDEVMAELEQLAAGRTVEGRPAVVRRVAEGAAAHGAHIVFFGERRDGRLREAIEATPGPVLVVSEQASALRSGSVINFSTDAGRVRFSASVSAAETRGLKLSARLLAVAQTIDGRAR